MVGLRTCRVLTLLNVMEMIHTLRLTPTHLINEEGQDVTLQVNLRQVRHSTQAQLTIRTHLYHLPTSWDFTYNVPFLFQDLRISH